jgi:hypothetical protein
MLKKLSGFIILLFMLVITLFTIHIMGASADTAVPAPPIVPPNLDEVQLWLSAVGGLKGAQSLAIVLFVVQGLLLFFRSSMSKFAGIWRYLIVCALTFGGAVLAGIVQGKGIMVIADATVLSAFQVFAHQLVKQANKFSVERKPKKVKKVKVQEKLVKKEELTK